MNRIISSVINNIPSEDVVCPNNITALHKSHAQRSPGAVAIAAPGGKPLTYNQLYRQVEQIVAALNDLGIGRNDRVAAVLPNGPEAAIAFLGVAAGATYAPLNPANPTSEFESYFCGLSPKALLVESGSDSPAIPVAQRLSIPIIELSPLGEPIAGAFTLRGQRGATEPEKGFAEAEDVALILHTSGTTSRPKRVPLTHSNLLVSARNIAATLHLQPNDCCLNVMPLFHIHGLVGALLSSMMAGGSVVCTPGFEAEEFLPWLETLRPTWYTAVPTVHQAVVGCAQAEAKRLKHHSLRFIRSSSSALPARVLHALEEIFDVPVIESYGMTEAAHQITSNPLPPLERKAGSVGLAAGPNVAVMDGAGNLLPAWHMGEVVVRGANVMRGYDHNPSANGAGFTREWLRTGDQGYLDSDGYLFLAGRLKEIANRGGAKISLREIDAALLEHPQVSQAATFPVPHPTLGEDIAAAIVVLDKDQITEPMIREYLLKRLAAFKVPSHISFVDEIPKGSTGKIQRLKLAEVFAQRFPKEFVRPQNELEILVSNIFAEVLRIEKVSVCDNFLELGGDSLRATQVLSRIAALFQVNLPIVTLFNKPTVAELAHEIAASMESLPVTSKAELVTALEDFSKEGERR